MQGLQLAGLLKHLAPGASAVAFGLSILAISPTSAASEQCRAIKSEKDRLACVNRDGASARNSDTGAKPAADKKAKGAVVDPVDMLKMENDKVSARLKGICRGC